MRKFWKYKGMVELPAENNYRDLLLKDAVDNCGCVDFKDGFCITKNNERYKAIKFIFHDANGLDTSIDRMNLTGLIQALDILDGKFKILFPREFRSVLDNSIEFYRRCLKNTKDKAVQEVIAENLRIMMQFNDHKYVSVILFISESDLERFYKEMDMIADMTVYNKNQTIRLLDMLNNDMQ